MKRRNVRPGSVLFYIFFVPYTIGVVVFLIAGLSPSIANEFDGLHDSLHEFADDALLANNVVTIDFQNFDSKQAHRIVILGREGGRPVFSGPLVPSHGRRTFRFRAPRVGSYWLASRPDPDGDPLFKREIRFAEHGAQSIALRVPSETQHRFERIDERGWEGGAGRVAAAAHHADHGGRVTLESAFSLLNLGLGLLLISRRPRDRTARLLAVAMIGTGAMFNHQSHSTVTDYLIGDWGDAHNLLHLVSALAFVYAVVVFPDGSLLPLESRHRQLLRLGYGLATFVLAWIVLDDTRTGHPGQPFFTQPFFTVLFGLLIPLAGVGAQTYRLRRATDPVVQQQSRLLRWVLVPMFFVGAIYLVLTRAFENSDVVTNIGLAVFPALFALVPLALVMGILRYRLWDIDILVSRTLMSVGLAAFIGLVYVVVVVLFGVVLLGHSLGSRGFLQIVELVIAAIAFEPVREYLTRFANRLVYGQRATPYEAMADFSDRLGDAISVDEVLPRIAEATVKGVGGIAGRVTAFLPGGGSRTAEWPVAGTVESFSYVTPVTYRGEDVGAIAVAMPHGERLRPAEEALLTALAKQAGLAVNNARLTMELEARFQEMSEQATELRASRQRIVTARQVQRQRVVQLIHDRVETRLYHVSTTLDELEPLLSSDTDAAVDRADALVDECGDALDALRELARGIFPAILADQGVMVALESYVLRERLDVDVQFDGAANSDRYDPQAEATVYFCVIQALANAGTYAPGSNVVVRVHAEGENLVFSVSDDGPGVDGRRLRSGADIGDMRDRVEAIGGELDATSALGEGTVIFGWVPARSLLASVTEH